MAPCWSNHLAIQAKSPPCGVIDSSASSCPRKVVVQPARSHILPLSCVRANSLPPTDSGWASARRVVSQTRLQWRGALQVQRDAAGAHYRKACPTRENLWLLSLQTGGPQNQAARPTGNSLIARRRHKSANSWLVTGVVATEKAILAWKQQGLS